MGKRILQSLILLMLALGIPRVWRFSPKRGPAQVPAAQVTSPDAKDWEKNIRNSLSSQPMKPGRSRPYSRAAVLEAVAKDRFCELYRDNSQVPLRDEFEAITILPSVREASGDDAELKSFFAASVNESSTWESLEFLRALRLGGLMVGEQAIFRDGASNSAEARKVLEKLGSRHPDNAAYPYFMAALLAKAHASGEEIRREWSKAFAAQEFESHYLRIYSQLEDKGLNNPTSWIVSVGLLSRVPVPAYAEVSAALNPLIDSGDEPFLEGVLHLAEGMMSAGTRHKGASVSGVLEYAIGRTYYLRAWKRLHPGQEAPNIPSPRDWIDPQTQMRLTAVLPDLSEVFYQPGRECDPSRLERAFRQMTAGEE